MRKTVNGLTLLELLVCLCLLAILLSIATPSLSTYLVQAESKSINSSLRRMLAATREYAVNHSATVTLCGVDETFTCTRDEITVLAIFIDKNNNSRIDEGEELKYFHELKHQGNLRLRASLRHPRIRFQRDGAALEAGSFLYCRPEHPRASRRVTVSMSGRAYSAMDEDGDGLINDISGDPVRCETE